MKDSKSFAFARGVIVAALLSLAASCSRATSQVQTFASRSCPAGWRLLYVEHIDGGAADRAVCRQHDSSDTVRVSAGSLDRP